MDIKEKKLQVPEIGFYNLRKRATEEQLDYGNSILQNNITFSNSIAGSGKTVWAVACMKFLYEHKIINKAYYIVSPVEEKTLGYRPGNTKEKVEDYLWPLKDALAKIGDFPDKALDEKIGWIEMKPDTFLRGTNIEEAGIIIEEAQNYNKDQLKKTISRIHETCHAAVIGHEGQIDIKNKKESGFANCIEWFRQLEGVRPVGFQNLTKDFRGWISQHVDKW